MSNFFQSIKNTTGIPILIAGPCSAESEEQVLRTFEMLNGKAQLLRFGVWKPRTRPNSFEGIGALALEWIKSAKKIYPNQKVCIEIASAEHAKLALENQIDVVWIGARTTVNPFLVQEIANALSGSNIPVMVKNPVNPDLELWIGALERLKQAGLTNLAAVHRGFSAYKPIKYRNVPHWQIAIAFKNKFPEIPLICDPSHIAGERGLVAEVAQKALDLSFDGLMIETHPNPPKALSDAAQQVYLDSFGEFINSLNVRLTDVSDQKYLSRLAELREQIDTLDFDLLTLLEERSKMIAEIGKIKRENNVTIYQHSRWQEIVSTRPEWAKNKNLSPKFVQELWELIHDESIRTQNELFKN